MDCMMSVLDGLVWNVADYLRCFYFDFMYRYSTSVPPGDTSIYVIYKTVYVENHYNAPYMSKIFLKWDPIKTVRVPVHAHEVR